MIERKGTALLIYLDLDDLKIINDSCGHLEGNRALVVTANVLRACFRQSDILARLGGDEFCILMTDAGRTPPSKSASACSSEWISSMCFLAGISGFL